VDIHVVCDGLCLEISYEIYDHIEKALTTNDALAACLWTTVSMEKSNDRKSTEYSKVFGG